MESSNPSSSDQSADGIQPLRPFSALRCFWDAEMAADPSRCQGYLEVAIVLQAVKLQCEISDAQVSVSLPDRKQSLGEKSVEMAKRNTALDMLFPTTSVIVTAGRRVVFRSSGISLRNEMVDALEKRRVAQKRALSLRQRNLSLVGRESSHQASDSQQAMEESSMTIERRLYGSGKEMGRSQPTTTTASALDAFRLHSFKVVDPQEMVDESSLRGWAGSFHVHHPHAVVGIHLASLDPAVELTVDEILASRFIEANQLQSQPRTLHLTFDFECPISYAAIEPVARRFRLCRMTLTLQLVSTYTSLFRSFPALALNEPTEEIFPSGPHTPVRLLPAEFAPRLSVCPLESSEVKELLRPYSESREDIQTTFRHAQLCVDILVFWSVLLVDSVRLILSWNRPLLSFLVTVYVFLLVTVPSCRYSLIILAVACTLGLTRKVPDQISPRLIEFYATNATRAQPKRDTAKTTFQASASKASESEKPSSPLATDALMKTLIDSALPIELIQLTEWLRPLLVTWLPIAVWIHCLLVWTPSPVDHWWRMRCYLLHLSTSSEDSSSTSVQDSIPKDEKTAAGGRWRKSPNVKATRSTVVAWSNYLLPTPSHSLVLVIVCVIGSLCCFVFAERFLGLMVFLNCLWLSVLLVRYTSWAVAVRHGVRACFRFCHNEF